MIHTGDCLEVMRGMEADSVDAVVTDPPAGIAFMSKHWDRDKGGRTEWVAWMTEVMRECYRVLKPGGYAVVWSLPRTCHWTAWAMEDAGFIIRDQLAHVFASGFPKGRAQLKPAREDWWLARKPGPLQPLQIDATRIGTEERPVMVRTATVVGATAMAGESTGATANGEVTSQGRWPSNVLLSDPELFDEPNPEVVGSGATLSANLGSTRGRDTTGTAYGRGHGLERAETGQAVGYGDTGGYSRFFQIPSGPCRCDATECPDSPCRDPLCCPDCYCHSKDWWDDYPKAFIVPKSSRADREPVVRASKVRLRADITDEQRQYVQGELEAAGVSL